MKHLYFTFGLLIALLMNVSVADAALYNTTTTAAQSAQDATTQNAVIPLAQPAPAPVTPQPASPVSTPVTAPSAAIAEPVTPTVKPSDVTLKLAAAVGAVCPGHWDSQNCLSAVSTANLVMVSNYGVDLQNAGKADDAEQLKQHCAASTAAREKSFPAYAMKSAFIECANEITTLSDKTGIKPDPSAFQLLVAPTLCLDHDPRCGAISDQLKRFAAP